MKTEYDDDVKKWKKAYTDILEVCQKYHDFDNLYRLRDVDDIISSAKNHLLLIEWYEKYGLRIDHDFKPYSFNYIRLDDYTSLSHYGDGEKEKNAGSGKCISWSDDGKQPENEWLFIISFPTGAYIFGEDYNYQKELFKDFFNELKSYNPDYSDTANKHLYWKLENAKTIYEMFKSILNKYYERNSSELKQRKVEKLRAELTRLEG